MFNFLCGVKFTQHSICTGRRALCSLERVYQRDIGYSLSLGNMITADQMLTDEHNKGKTVVMVLKLTRNTNINSTILGMAVSVRLSSSIVTGF